ncbi:MAG: methionine synthase, partial [Gammaproteobacteria bacterium]
VKKVEQEYAEVRARHAGKQARTPWLSLAEARANRTPIDWEGYEPPAPRKPGLHVFDDYPLDEIAEYIDWTPFFKAWELTGSYPQILHDPVVGEQASCLLEDARKMLARILREGWLRARAVIGLFPANQVGFDDIQLFTDDTRKIPLLRLHHLRQQTRRPPGKPNQCLADFVAPLETGLHDWLGAFAVTAGIGIERHLARFEAEHDDYRAILLKALADRLAEAFAELMHARVRREFWGYAPDERLDNAALIREEYQGIRPAPGYPACPDHTEKALLWKLLDPVTNAGISLTESFAMVPTAAVSGWYFSHPQSRYFAVGKINRDQVEDYARRKGMPVETVEHWLAPNLGYTPGGEGRRATGGS